MDPITVRITSDFIPPDGEKGGWVAAIRDAVNEAFFGVGAVESEVIVSFDKENTSMHVTRDELIEAFTRWEIEYRDNPHSFMADVERFAETPEEFGEGRADALIGYVEDVRLAVDPPTEAEIRTRARDIHRARCYPSCCLPPIGVDWDEAEAELRAERGLA